MQRLNSFCLTAIISLGLLTAVGQEAGAVPTTQFTLTGDVAAPATYGLGALQSLPPTTETVTFQTGGGPQTGTFTGPLFGRC